MVVKQEINDDPVVEESHAVLDEGIEEMDMQVRLTAEQACLPVLVE